MEKLTEDLALRVIQQADEPGVLPALSQVEWFDDRFYKKQTELGHGVFQDMFYPSVTTILGIINKPWLGTWRGNVGNYEADKIMNYAAWRGSRIHDCAHKLQLRLPNGRFQEVSFLRDDGKPLYTQDEWLQIVRFKDAFDLLHPVVWGTEVVVFSDEFAYAGTTDMPWGLEKGSYKIGSSKVIVPQTGLYIGDLKTGSSVDDEYHLQTSAYAAAWMEQTGQEVVGTFILHTNTKSAAGFTVALRTFEQMVVDFEHFQDAHKMWLWKNATITPKVFSMPVRLSLNPEEPITITQPTEGVA